MHSLCITSTGTCKLIPRNCQTRLSAFSQEMGSNATAHQADRNAFLQKPQIFDATFLQQAGVGENITHKPRKQSVISPFVKNMSRRGKTKQVGTSWTKKKTRYAAGSHPAEDKKLETYECQSWAILRYTLKSCPPPPAPTYPNHPTLPYKAE